MAAITPKLRMKVTDIQPGAGGRPEVVDLVEVIGDGTNNNLHRLPSGGGQNVQIQPFKLSIDNSTAQGAFIKGAHYKVEFTLLTADGIV